MGVLKAAGTSAFSFSFWKAEQAQFSLLLIWQELQSPELFDGLPPALLWDEAPASPYLQPGKFSLHWRPALLFPPSLVLSRKFLGVLCAIIQAVNESLSIVTLRDTTCHRPLRLAVQMIFHLLYRPAIPIFWIWLQTFCWETMSRDVLKAKTDDIHCCSFVHWAYHLLIGGSEVAKDWFILNKSMCAVHSHLLSLCVLPAGFLFSLSRELMLIYLCWYFLFKEDDFSFFPASRKPPPMGMNLLEWSYLGQLSWHLTWFCGIASSWIKCFSWELPLLWQVLTPADSFSRVGAVGALRVNTGEKHI